METTDLKDCIRLELNGEQYTLAPWKEFDVYSRCVQSTHYRYTIETFTPNMFRLFGPTSNDCIILYPTDLSNWRPVFCQAFKFLQPIYEKINLQQEFDDLEEAKRNVDNFLIRINHLKMFI